MVLTEQKLKKFKRTYFRGIKEPSKNFELTTDFNYALYYAGKYGTITEYKLNTGINVFNAKCKTDEGALRKYCQEEWPEFLREIELLKTNDWSTEGRSQLVDVIKFLGYDGYLNYEIDKRLLENLRSFHCHDFTGINLHSPSIAIFNESCLTKISQLQGETLWNSPLYLKLQKREKEYIKMEMARSLYENKLNVEELANRIFQGLVAFPTPSEVVEVMSETESEELIHLMEEVYRREKAVANAMMCRIGINLLDKVEKRFHDSPIFKS